MDVIRDSIQLITGLLIIGLVAWAGQVANDPFYIINTEIGGQVGETTEWMHNAQIFNVIGAAIVLYLAFFWNGIKWEDASRGIRVVQEQKQTKRRK